MCGKTINIEGYHERVREAIKESGMSAAEVARKAGIRRQTFYNTTMMHSGNLARFCAVTGVSADWILGLKGEMR